MLKNNIKSNYKITVNMTNIYYDKFIVYTDGACRNNGKTNALSSIGIYFSNRNLKKIDSVSEVLKMIIKLFDNLIIYTGCLFN